jgi:cellulose biosynthesis protein BcsE
MNDTNHADADDYADPAQQRATSPGRLRGLCQAIGLVHARPPVRLAIEGLPDKWSVLGRGRIHGIYAEAGMRACDSLIWNTARDAAMANVTVVRALPRAEVASQLRALGFVHGQHAQGWPRHFNVLSLSSPSSSPAAYDAGIPRGAARATSLGTALRALQRAGVRARSLCIIEGAEQWFNWRDPVALNREADMLASWCERRQVSMVLILAPRIVEAESSSDNVAAALTRARDVLYTFHLHFSGVARLDQVAGELRWHVDFWRAGRALVAGETCALRVDEAARLVALPHGAGCGCPPATWLAQDERRVIAGRALVEREGWIPSNWEIQPDNDAVFAASVGAQAATIVFTFDTHTRLDGLCTMLHTLRVNGGGALKIAVAERGEAMGLQHELLMLAVGANLVLRCDMPFSRIPSALQSLQGQLHTRAIADDWHEVLAASQPDPTTGYVPMASFCERVTAALQRGAPLLLPHVLVELSLRPDVAHLDALRACQPQRPGEFVTVCGSHVYLFLFACRPPDVAAALVRIVNVPVPQLFDRVTLYPEHASTELVEVLRDRQRHASAPDYSDVLPAGELAACAAAMIDIGAGGYATGTGAGAVARRLLHPVNGQGQSQGQGQGQGQGQAQGQGQPGHARRAEPCAMPLNHQEIA